MSKSYISVTRSKCDRCDAERVVESSATRPFVDVSKSGPEIITFAIKVHNRNPIDLCIECYNIAVDMIEEFKFGNI